MPFRILIVDDSPAMRSFVRRVLDMSGFGVGQCLEASNGEEALALLAGGAADVILTDINMPVMDGEELIRRVEADERLRTIPVVVISTDRTTSRIDSMLALGARGYVAKPFRPETLRDELERVLEVAHDA